ncbi:MAG TPA: pyrroloquinoline quinone-dependent dehydrogenase [Cyclobacteriaceae bacterium]|nr:pyrroloquinoline quinone-dependent dehydrogenase [Cyclobacteriaceae bacterium]
MPKYFAALLVLAAIAFSCSQHSDSTQWEEYLGGPDRNHYSSLTQINPDNVAQLEIAWEYHTGDSGQIQCNPIIVDGRLYAVTATGEPFALDATTGEELWRIPDTTRRGAIIRGVTYWQNGDDKRILYTRGEWLCAVEALTGNPITSFGEGGKTSLKAGLGETAKTKHVESRTPGTVYENLIIMPLSLSEGSDAAPGHVQAFDIVTGKLAWVFKTIPGPGELGYDTWPEATHENSRVGAANNWAGMSVDRKRGIVYVPTGSAAFDFYGGDRIGSNLFANTLLALNAKTGERLWHFQFVHHDIFDRDAPAPPNLLTVTRDGKKVDAVAQVTKQGYVFLFNRETGEPLFPIEEVPAPPSDVPGEEAWPTQPRPVLPLPYARQTLTEDDINPYSAHRDSLLTAFRNSRFEGPFTPLSKNGSIVFPGLDGGAEWGGAAVDPEGIMYINSNEASWLISLDKAQRPDAAATGAQLYTTFCASCHGANRRGSAASGFPSLLNPEERLTRDAVADIISHGKGRMAGLPGITDAQKADIVAFLFGDKTTAQQSAANVRTEITSEETIDEYKISGYTKWLDKDGYPAIAPPWGTLNAIDLNTGEYLWKIVYGEYPELMDQGIPRTGSESYGGPVITASSLLFIAGTKDKKFRAYRKETGELLWETELPAAAFATPATYEVNGKQYIVLACGGTKLGAEKGDSYVAFALP